MVMLVYDLHRPTLEVVENGKPIGEVLRPLVAAPFGRGSGTVYLARRVRRGEKVVQGGGRRKGTQSGS